MISSSKRSITVTFMATRKHIHKQGRGERENGVASRGQGSDKEVTKGPTTRTSWTDKPGQSPDKAELSVKNL